MLDKTVVLAMHVVPAWMLHRAEGVVRRDLPCRCYMYSGCMQEQSLGRGMPRTGDVIGC